MYHCKKQNSTPITFITNQFSKAKVKDRKQLIFQARKQRNKVDDKCRLIFTHNKGNPPLHDWMRKSKKLLVSAKAKKFGDKFQISYKQPQNLKKTVSGPNKGAGGRGALVAPPGEAGCFKCNHCRVSCPVMVETKKFRSTNTNRCYIIDRRLTCDSPFVIYLATCRKCRGQYVGKSVTPFKKRHSNHKQEIKRKNGGIGQHYGGDRSCSYQDISLILIEQVKMGDRQELARREQYWQHQLRAFVENGGNGHCIRKDFT